MSLQVDERTALLGQGRPVPSFSFHFNRAALNGLAFLGFTVTGVLTYKKESSLKSIFPFIGGAACSFTNIACDLFNFWRARSVNLIEAPLIASPSRSATALEQQPLTEIFLEIKEKLSLLGTKSENQAFNWMTCNLNNPQLSQIILDIHFQIERIRQLGLAPKSDARVEMSEILAALENSPSHLGEQNLQGWQQLNAKLTSLLQAREEQVKTAYLRIFQEATTTLKVDNDRRVNLLNLSFHSRMPRNFAGSFDTAWDNLAAELDRAAVIQSAFEAKLKEFSKSDLFIQKIIEINEVLLKQLSDFCGEDTIQITDPQPCLKLIQEGDEATKTAWKELDMTLQKIAKALNKFEYAPLSGLSPSSSSSECTPIKNMRKELRNVRSLNLELSDD